jgi:hypothetical protein
MSNHLQLDRAFDADQGHALSPVVSLEIAENFCAPYIAGRILAEVRGYFQVPLPASLAQDLADRADWAVFHDPHYGKLAKGPQARAWIKSFMCRWLASPQQKEHPGWYRRLTEASKLARLLPALSRRKPAKPAVKATKKRLV